MIRKGIILAGGLGTRMSPITKSVNKQLLPIYDKPLIYYPLSILMLAGIKEILIIVNKGQVSQFKKILQNGENFGTKIQYKEQKNPNGLPEAFIIGEKFIGRDNVCLALGDNIFYGQGLTSLLQQAVYKQSGATIFGYKVKDPQSFGIVEFDNQNKAISIEEKPTKPKSCFAVTGLYFYTNDVVKMSKSLKPSKRNELEITDLNNLYLQKEKIDVSLMEEGFTWLDTGTFDSLHKASIFVRLLQKTSNYRLGLIDEVAFQNNFISSQQLEKNLVYLSEDFQKYLKKKYL